MQCSFVKQDKKYKTVCEKLVYIETEHQEIVESLSYLRLFEQFHLPLLK